MCSFAVAALIGLASSSCASDGASQRLAPTDPAITSHWSPPPSPTAGLRTFKPVDAKDWREMNRAITPAPEKGSDGKMSAMPGMGGKK